MIYPFFLALNVPILAQIQPPQGVPPPQGYGSEAEAIGGLFSYSVVGAQRLFDPPIINSLGAFRFNDSPAIKISEGGQLVRPVESLGQRWVTKQLADGNTEVTAVFVHKYTVEIDITFETIVQPQDFPMISETQEVELYKLQLWAPATSPLGLPDVYNYVPVGGGTSVKFTIPYKTPEKNFDTTFNPSTKGFGIIRCSVNPDFSFPAVLNTSGDFYYQYNRFWVGITDIRSNGWINGTISDQQIEINPDLIPPEVSNEDFHGGEVDADHRAHYYGTVETTTATIEESKGFIAGGSPVGRPANLFIDERGNDRASESALYDPTLMDGVNQLSVNAYLDFHLRPRAKLFSVTHRYDYLLEHYAQDVNPFSSTYGAFIPYADVYIPNIRPRVIVGSATDNAFVHNFYNVTIYLATYYDLIAEDTNQDPFIWNENDFADDPFEFFENNVFNARAWGATQGAEYINLLENEFLNTVVFLIIFVGVAILIIAVSAMGFWFGGRYLKRRNIERAGGTVTSSKEIRPIKRSRFALYLTIGVSVIIVIAVVILVVYLAFFNPLLLYLQNPLFTT